MKIFKILEVHHLIMHHLIIIMVNMPHLMKRIHLLMLIDHSHKIEEYKCNSKYKIEIILVLRNNLESLFNRN
jgi:hypothetical protein